MQPGDVGCCANAERPEGVVSGTNVVCIGAWCLLRRPELWAQPPWIQDLGAMPIVQARIIGTTSPDPVPRHTSPVWPVDVDCVAEVAIDGVDVAAVPHSVAPT